MRLFLKPFCCKEILVIRILQLHVSCYRFGFRVLGSGLRVPKF